MSHGHGHGPPADQRGRLGLVLALSLVVLVVELVGAVVTGSLALLADAGHMLSDVAGLGMAFTAATLVRRPATDRRTWGFRRAEILAAAAQAALLLVVGLWVLVQGVERLLDPPSVGSGGMLLFGVVGLVANLVAIGVLLRGRGASLNTRAAFLEVVNDALGSIAVVIAALVIARWGWDRADAVASLLIAGLILPRTLLLLRESVEVLMESTPAGLDLADVRARVLALDHVVEVHDLHASQVATGLPTLTAHVVLDERCFHSGHSAELLDQVQACLVDDFDIAHSTIQFEAPHHVEHEQRGHP
ncbi:cation diffusion facilitator family transporter [Nocardioides acrostichi]|uniref:Cation transporter n=1 Tax=Nocardioides acrostichi TaxID=2784339 RepID=A0A930UU21_9ACTN|nr:cation diffusion facilitator family transporter [Nocardioides acrostichi]MBF4160843.1 cation transporter [Nocardioides acrostichi]